MNITGLQFFGREDPAVQEFFESNELPINSPIQSTEKSLRVNLSLFINTIDRSVSLQASAALIYDSVYFFARALRKFVEQHSFNITRLTCDSQQAWIHGAAFAHFLKQVESSDEH